MEKELVIEKLNGKREGLQAKLPLKMPYSISVTTANVCNLKCEFCDCSKKNRKMNKAFLSMDTFKLAIDSIKDVNWKLKQMVLVGLGEPLLNKNIVDFVKYIKEKKVADKVHIVTNGVLLTQEMSDNLINAGVDILRISINGLSDEDYEKYTGTKIDFSELVHNITYFYNHKKENMKVYVKIMNYMVEEQERVLEFHKIFDEIADVVNIEQLTEMSESIDYSEVGKLDYNVGLKGFKTVETEICPLSFYHIYLNAEGTISACCVAGPWRTPPALIMGDLYKESIKEIWNGKNFREFWIRMLEKGKDFAHPTCKECRAYKTYIYPEDIIDEERERILNELKNI